MEEYDDIKNRGWFIRFCYWMGGGRKPKEGEKPHPKRGLSEDIEKLSYLKKQAIEELKTKPITKEDIQLELNKLNRHLEKRVKDGFGDFGALLMGAGSIAGSGFEKGILKMCGVDDPGYYIFSSEELYQIKDILEMRLKRPEEKILPSQSKEKNPFDRKAFVAGFVRKIRDRVDTEKDAEEQLNAMGLPSEKIKEYIEEIRHQLRLHEDPKL